jgi:type VI secretion system secreted protein Hcp
MAVDMFIKIDGIDGEAQDSKHKNEIEVLAWSWGASQAGSFATGSGGGSGKVSVQDLSFTKWFDKASPILQQHCFNGKHIGKAVLVCRKASGDNPLEYLKVTLEDILVSSFNTGGSGGEDRITESVSLNFTKVKIEYTEQTAKGGEGAKPKFAWDIKQHKEAA